MEKEKKNNKKAIIISISTITLLVILIFAFILMKVILPSKYISTIDKNYDLNQYEKVMECDSKLESIKSYLKNDNDKYKSVQYKVKYSNAIVAFENEQYDKALSCLKQIEIPDEKVKNKTNECKYELGKKYISNEQYAKALEFLEQVTDKEDLSELKDKSHYNLAIQKLEEKQYDKALKEIEKVTNKRYENLENTKKKIHYEYGKDFFSKKDYNGGIVQLEQAKDYEDANDLINNMYIEQAEKYIKDGKIKEAQNTYNYLSDGLEYNGIKVSDRKKQLNKFASLIDAIGKKNASKSYCESRNVWKYDGRWTNWYVDTVSSSEYIDTSLELNKDGTVNLKGKVYFYAFDNFSSLAEYCNAKIVSRTIKIENIDYMQSTYDLDENTKLLYSKGVFSIKYNKKDNYSTNFYNLYTSSVTY